ncbi:MAG: TPR repeat protein [Candidatus Azotimanducaceae bacterium]
MLRLISLFLLVFCLPVMASFDDAQQAAAVGDYREVVGILSKMLAEDDLDSGQRVVAYANRGIAYSLLKAYALAKQDLEAALIMNPNHPLTLNHLGLLAEQVDQDYILAAGFYQKAIELQFSASQVNLANLYWYGKGVPKNAKRAFELYRQAAEANYNMAFAPLGRIYASGEGAPQNHKRAFDLFNRASESGVTEANYYLGFAFEKGRGVKQDLVQAKRNYQIAAIQGHGEAQNALGYLYRRGLGVEQDYVQAATWYQLASDQGVPGAMNRLSWLLAGCPVEKVCNGESAIILAQQALEQGETPERLDSLAAGYARTGDFDRAIKAMDKVLQLLPANSRKRSSYSGRLERYRQGIALQL